MAEPLIPFSEKRPMTLTIRPPSEAERDVFGGIWIPWLKETIGIDPEPEDLQAMADPLAYYGTSGGVALLAILDGAPVGTVAIKGLGSAGFEFCKLVVQDQARGQGVGRALVEACLNFCAARSANLWLQSFNKLEVALALYRQIGFCETEPPQEMSVLGRTEIVMSFRP